MCFSLSTDLTQAETQIGDEAGQTVISRIIPVIAFLRQHHRVAFSVLFSDSILEGENNLSEDISANLDVSDRFFNGLTQK